MKHYLSIAENLRYFLAVACAAVTTIAGAQAFPSKPIRLIVTYPAGGGADNIARSISNRLAEKLGQPVVIENRVGAAGVLGTKSLITAPPDGHTLLLASVGPNSISPVVNPGVASYDPLKDFTPITVLTRIPAFMVVSAKSPLKTIDDVIKLGRSGTPVQFASSGVGSFGHLAGESFNLAAGTKYVNVPYKGNAESVVALINESVQFAFSGASDVATHLKSGQLRAIAVFGSTRSTFDPSVPTAKEAGFDVELPSIWFGVMGPPKMKPELARQLSQVIGSIMDEPETKARFVSMGMPPATSTPEEFAHQLKSEHAQYLQVVKSKNIKAE